MILTRGHRLTLSWHVHGLGIEGRREGRGRSSRTRWGIGHARHGWGRWRPSPVVRRWGNKTAIRTRWWVGILTMSVSTGVMRRREGVHRCRRVLGLVLMGMMGRWEM
jgi:hypothetical protein